jgi:hypothetical protein
MTLPQNRKPLSLSQFQGPHYDSQGRRILHSHPSTWEAEAKALRIAITHALERLDASLFTNAEHEQAKGILRKALK